MAGLPGVTMNIKLMVSIINFGQNLDGLKTYVHF